MKRYYIDLDDSLRRSANHLEGERKRNQNYEGFLFQTLPTGTDITNETYKDAMFLSRSGQLVLGEDLITDTTGAGGGVLSPDTNYNLQVAGNSYFKGNVL